MVALGDAESEMHRTLVWLETEQDSFWQGQIRKRQEIVTRAKEAVRMKKVFKDAVGSRQSVVDEEKALQIAQKRLAEAEQKLLAVRKWSRVLQKEVELYKGSVQRFATTAQADLPAAAAHLENLSAKLDAYVAVQPAEVGAGAVGEGSVGAQQPGMARSMALPPGAGEDELARLLARVPSFEIRVAAPGITELRLRLGAIPPVHLAAIKSITAVRDPLPDDAKVLVNRSIAGSSRVFLHREANSAGDSGWSILPADLGPIDEWETIPVAEVLRAFPNWRELLVLPAGFSVIIGHDGIAAMFDSRQQAVWRRE